MYRYVASARLPPPRNSNTAWAERSQKVANVASLSRHGHFKVIFTYAIICLRCVLNFFSFFNAVPLLRHHSQCLESVQRKGPINDWSLNSHSVLYCIVKVFFICKLEWNPQITSCVYYPVPPFLQPLITPALYPSLILETNDQLYLFLLLPGNGISRWALPSPTMQCCKSL